MTNPTRVQRTQGRRMPPNTVYVGRPTIWGNPFDAPSFGRFASVWLSLDPREKANHHIAVVEIYRDWIDRWPRGVPEVEWGKLVCGLESQAAPSRGQIVRHLRGLNLACWCPLDRPCHADVLLDLAND